MNIVINRHVQGPSPFGACTAAVLIVEWDDRTAQQLARADAAVQQPVWRQVLAGLGLRARADETVAAAVHAVPDPDAWLEQALWLADRLRIPFCIEAVRARIYQQSSRRLVLVVPCDDAQTGLQSTALAMKMVLDAWMAVEDEPGWIERWQPQLLAWQHWAEAQALKVNARLVAREAHAMGIPWYRRAGSNRLLQLGQGVKARRLDGAVTDAINRVAFEWSQDKWQTAQLLAQHGLPTATPQRVASLDEALQMARQMGWPVVVKPRATNKGVGVTADVRGEAELARAWERAAHLRGGVLLERHIPGEDHRLLVVGGQFVAAAQRRAAEVVGVGQHTIVQRVAQLNQARRTGRAPGVYLPTVEVLLDDEAERILAQQGLKADSVLAHGQVARLRGHANLSTGGYSVDVTPQVHPDNRALAERAARLVGLSMAGVDLQTTDISRSWREVGGAVLELNAGPGLLPHLPATAHHHVLRAIVKDLFPQGDGRIPTAGITGSVGKTTTCRMLAAILEHAGHTVALATTQGTVVGGQPVRQGDLAAGRYLLPLLHDPAVTAAVVEMARGGLIKQGMGLDAVDVGAVLNVYDNHLGLDGVDSREQLAAVKQLVVRHARRLAVLNADDPLCLRMREGLDPDRVCLVSETLHEGVVEHVRLGGLAAVVKRTESGSKLCLLQGQQVLGEMEAAQIPATWQGTFRPAVVNALFAIALAHGLGVPFETSRAALERFDSDYATNPGRMNRLKGLPFEMLLTYADGPQALAELARFVSQPHWPTPRTLVFYAGGNRPDGFIVDSAKAVAGAFDRYYCTDMEEDRRGRPAGEVAALLAKGLRDGGVPEAAIVVEPSCSVAVDRALDTTPAGGMLVVESYHHEKVVAAVKRRFEEGMEQ